MGSYPIGHWFESNPRYQIFFREVHDDYALEGGHIMHPERIAWKNKTNKHGRGYGTHVKGHGKMHKTVKAGFPC